MIENADDKVPELPTIDGWIKGLFDRNKKSPVPSKNKARSVSAPSKVTANEKAKAKAVANLQSRIEHLSSVIEAKNQAIENQTYRIDRHLTARTNLSQRLTDKDDKIAEQKDQIDKLISKAEQQSREIIALQADIEEKNFDILERESGADWEGGLYEVPHQFDIQLSENYELQLAKKDQSIEKLHEISEKRMAAINNLKASRDKLVEGNSNLRGSLKQAIARGKYFSENPAINRYLRFARNCMEQAEALKADAYCGHGVMPMPAIAAVQEAVGGIAICDVIEIPAFSKRAVKSTWHPTMLRMIDMSMESYLRHCDYLITVGWALGAMLKPIHKDVRVLPNYRPKIKVKPNSFFRETFAIPESDHIVLSISTIASGFEEVLEAMQILPPNVHLVNMGKFVPASYDQKIAELVKKMGLRDRVHFTGFVPYDQLANTASGADIGLIIRDPEIPNNKISLPNRVFDYMVSGIPIVAPDMPDIHKFISENKFGYSIHGTSSKSWAEGIKKAIIEKDTLKMNALKAASQFTWNSLEPTLPELFGNPNEITFIGFSDLTKNNRTMRIVKSLVKQGVKVKVAGPINPEYKLPRGAKFVHVEQG